MITGICLCVESGSVDRRTAIIGETVNRRDDMESRGRKTGLLPGADIQLNRVEVTDARLLEKREGDLSGYWFVKVEGYHKGKPFKWNSLVDCIVTLNFASLKTVIARNLEAGETHYESSPVKSRLRAVGVERSDEGVSITPIGEAG